MQEVVRLEDHVAELGVGDALLLETGAHRLLGQHEVHREMLAHVPKELNGRKRAQPVVVVDKSSLKGPRGEVEEGLHLQTDLLHPCVHEFLVVQSALGCAPTGVAYQTGAAAHERDGPVTRQLEAAQSYERDQAADMEAVGSGIEAAIQGLRALGQKPPESFGIGILVDELAPLQFVVDLCAHFGPLLLMRDRRRPLLPFPERPQDTTQILCPCRHAQTRATLK